MSGPRTPGAEEGPWSASSPLAPSQCAIGAAHRGLLVLTSTVRASTGAWSATTVQPLEWVATRGTLPRSGECSWPWTSRRSSAVHPVGWAA